MNLKKFVRDSYREAVAFNKNIDDSLRTALKTNERVPQFIDNLVEEFRKIQKMRVEQGKKPFDQKYLKDAVYDMTDVFICTLKEEARKKHESDIAKAARKAKMDDVKDKEATLAGNPQGDYEGIHVLDREVEDASGKTNKV